MTKKDSFFKRYDKSDFLVMGVVLQLMFINTASLNMLIPSYSTIIADFGIRDSLIYIPDSLSVLISAFVMILWGYFTDKLDRNKVIHGGAFLSTIGFIFTANCTTFEQLLIGRIITGAGMGFAIPVGYSILSDIILPDERSGLFGFLTIFSSISNGTGQGLSAFIGPMNIFGFKWKFPFIVLSVLAVIAVIQLIFVKLPEKGSTEESLAELYEYEEMEYGYTIDQKELIKILKKPTNRNLIINGFFSIIPGTIIIFSLITTFSHPEQGILAPLPNEIRTQVSTIMAGMTSLGYLIGSLVLAWVGDIVFKKNKKNRARLAFISNFISIPLCVLMIYQMKPIAPEVLPTYPEIIPNAEMTGFIIETIQVIFQTYPAYWGYVIFALLGTFFSAGMVTNKKAVMMDVNLPEHRGTATSFFQLTEQIGKSLTLLVAAGLVAWLGSFKAMMYFGLIFWIPSSIFWYLATQTVVRDINKKSMVLRERAQISFIDYFFELEIAIDDGIQKIQDAKDILRKDPKQAEELIDRAVNRFVWITAKAHDNKMVDLEERAHNLLQKAILFQEDLSGILKTRDHEHIKQLYNKIDETWEESDFGNLETLYESAYLKVCEARLRRAYNPFETEDILQKAVNIYDRVIRLSSDRVRDIGIKKMKADELALQERIHNLLVLAQKSKSNTELLKDKLDQIIDTLTERDITKQQLSEITAITNQYGVELKEIIKDSFDRRTVKKVKRAMNEMDHLFEEYDQWQETE